MAGETEAANAYQSGLPASFNYADAGPVDST
jgi:hypothetical protein